ncbi:TetR family transcriptional regulator [Streptomyces fagopyri]|uniref:TetR family transcriptional regulator n=1 Tax=Streptomyces fagopyri TaxID=2662397 RepID=UPI0033C2E214
MHGAGPDAIEAALGRARPRESPVQAALHRYVEGVIEVDRTWPVDLARMPADAPSRERRDRAVREVETFLTRTTDEGLLRRGLPPGFAASIVPLLVHQVARNLPRLTAAQAADVAVHALLNGIGAVPARSPLPQPRSG